MGWRKQGHLKNLEQAAIHCLSTQLGLGWLLRERHYLLPELGRLEGQVQESPGHCTHGGQERRLVTPKWDSILGKIKLGQILGC